MKDFIDYLERKIEGCDSLGRMEREKAVYQSVLKDYRKQFAISGVGNCKRDETLELLEEIMTKVKEANEEVENGIYDPMLEVAKHILNNYKIERR